PASVAQLRIAFPCCCSPREAAPRTCLTALPPALTTIFPNRLNFLFCSPVCKDCCAAATGCGNRKPLVQPPPHNPPRPGLMTFSPSTDAPSISANLSC